MTTRMLYAIGFTRENPQRFFGLLASEHQYGPTYTGDYSATTS